MRGRAAVTGRVEDGDSDAAEARAVVSLQLREVTETVGLVQLGVFLKVPTFLHGPTSHLLFCSLYLCRTLC